MNIIIISSIILLVLDTIFIYFMSSTFTSLIYDVQRSPLQINIYGVILCYIIIILGLNYFIIQRKKSVLDAFLLGILVYGVYETTSLALLKKWKPITVIIDTLWGGILFALTTYFTYLLKY